MSRTEPHQQPAEIDPCWQNLRKCYRTKTGVVIGLLVPADNPLRHAPKEERVEKLLLWGRPLAHDQMMVAAMCTAGRRP